MRDIALTLIVLVGLGYTLRKPVIGIYLWSWLSYMNPHRLTWGFAYSVPFAQLTAIALFISILVNGEVKRIPGNATIVVWSIFLLWMCISTLFAFYLDSASTQLVKVLKIQLLTFLTMMLLTDQERIDKLIWVIVASIGFYSTKGGLFTIMTGGAHRVWGPAGSYIEENNSLALATLMIIPLMIYLYRLTERKLFKAVLALSILLSVASVLGSQSRGAFLAIAAVAGFFWLKSRAKLLSGLAIVVVAAIGISLMPASWHERMGSIQNYEEDASAMGRINAWTYSINVANHHLTGGGFESWSAGTFAMYAPVPEDVHAAHSIFFGVLADHGWPGLILFLLILLLSWRSLSRVIRLSRDDSRLAHQNLLARMLQVSLVAWFSGGAFLSLAYFDLPWHVIAIAVLLRHQLETREKTGEIAPATTSRRNSVYPPKYGYK
jgi:probable O-glycosylation ligase (exosortase A-associated)